MTHQPKFEDLISKYDTFLFDWDGTICATWDLWFECFVTSAHEDYGLTHVTKKEAVENMGRWDAPIRMGYPADKFDLQEYRDKWNRFTPFVAKNAPLFNGIEGFISALKSADKKLAVVSSATRKFIETSMEQHSMTEVFRLVICSEDVYAHKPDPEPILKAIDELASNLSKTLMIGDSPHDLVAAKNAKIDSLFFYPKEHYFIDKELVFAEAVPTYECNDWASLLA